MEHEVAPAAFKFVSLLPLIVMILIVGLTAHFLAREKGRNVVLWTILGCIPFINFFFIWFFVGATNLRLEKKLDLIIQKQNNQ